MFFRSSHYNPFLFGKMLTSSVVISVGWKFSCGCLCMPLHSTHFPKITKKKHNEKDPYNTSFFASARAKSQVTGSHLSRSTPQPSNPQTSSLPTHFEALQDGHYRDTRSSQAKRTRGTRPTCMACMARTARTTRRGTFARPRRHWDGVKHRLQPQKKALIEVQKLGISTCSWRLLFAVPRCVWMLLDNCINCIIQ